MKKFLLAASLFTMALNAQTGVNNLDFENWSGAQPTGFSIVSGVSQQTATPQSGTKYARITSNGQGFPNVTGYLGLNGSGSNVLAGVPYNQTPTSVTGYIRTNMVGTDTIYIHGHLRKNFSTFVGTWTYSTATTYTAWHQITIPINYLNAQTPDTIQMTFVANKSFMNMKPVGGNGTYLELDNFSLIAPSVGIESFNLSNDTGIYPNPASTQFHIETPIEFNGEIELYDAGGKLVIIQKAGEGKNTVDLDQLTNGLYLYKLNDKNKGYLISGRVIVTK